MDRVSAELTAVDDGDSHEDTRAAANHDHKVGNDSKQTEDGTAERRWARRA